MKKILALVCTLLVLCGCSQSDRVQCADCGEWITRGIPLSDGDTLCGGCFADSSYLICRSCGDAYDPLFSRAADLSYCARCGQEYAGACEGCGDYYLFTQLVQSEDGYTLCPLCANARLLEIIQNPDTFKYTEEDTKAAYDTGYEEGYQAGLAAGTAQGYESGYTDGSSTVSRTVQSAVNEISGNRTSGGSTAPQPQSMTVYITNTGSKYHRAGCQYLKKSQIAISLDEAQAQGYTACSRCW